MQDLSDIISFIKVVRNGGFTNAARELGLPKSTLSRKVINLEERLGISLLQRTTRKISLTNAGLKYFQKMQTIIDELERVEKETLSNEKNPQGLIKLTAPIETGMRVLPTLLKNFNQMYPQVEFDIILTDRIVDLVGEGFDLAFRSGNLTDSTLKARKIGATYFALYASPEFISRQSIKLDRPQIIEKIETITFSNEKKDMSWKLTNGKTTLIINHTNSLRVNNLTTIFHLAVNGLGVAFLPEFVASEAILSKKLIQLFPDWTSQKSNINLVYPANKFMPYRLRIFIDFIVKNYEKLVF